MGSAHSLNRQQYDTRKAKRKFYCKACHVLAVGPVAGVASRFGSHGIEGVTQRNTRKQRRRVLFKEFQPPRLRDLQRSCRARTRKYFADSRGGTGLPDAPRSTTSISMGANKPGVHGTSPSPATQSLFQQPVASPFLAMEDIGELIVNQYGSMIGVIDPHDMRLRTLGRPGSEHRAIGDRDNGFNASTVLEANTSREGRADNSMRNATGCLDQLAGSFTVADTCHGGQAGDQFFRARIEEQESQIASLEKENLNLKERLNLAQTALQECRRDQADDLATTSKKLLATAEESCAALAV